MTGNNNDRSDLIVSHKLIWEHGSELSEEQCIVVTRYWMNILRLNDWAVKIKFKRSDDLNGAVASIHGRPDCQEAILNVLNPIDFNTTIAPYDMEQWIVHELVHLCSLAWYDWTQLSAEKMTTTENSLCIEQFVDKMAQSLVTMRRNNQIELFEWEKES